MNTLAMGDKKVDVLKDLIHYNLGKAAIQIGNLRFLYARKYWNWVFFFKVCPRVQC